MTGLELAHALGPDQDGVVRKHGLQVARERRGLELASNALCRGEVCRWRHGDYTLVNDPGEAGRGWACLEAGLCFNAEG